MSGDSDGRTPTAGGNDDEGLLANLDIDLDAEDVPEDPFEEMDVADYEDGDWERLADGDADSVEVLADDVLVPKRTYCERCEHFSDPPEVRCEHPGTEINELADMDHFRVENCPVVAERRKMSADHDRE